MTRAIVLLSSLLLFSACNAPPKKAFVYQNVILGADFMQRPNQQTIQTTLGYKRLSESVVPRKSEDPNADAMSVLSKNHLEANGLGLNRIQQIFATGTEAEKLSAGPDNKICKFESREYRDLRHENKPDHRAPVLLEKGIIAPAQQ